jgi:hypothetical protein
VLARPWRIDQARFVGDLVASGAERCEIAHDVIADLRSGKAKCVADDAQITRCWVDRLSCGWFEVQPGYENDDGSFDYPDG